MGGPTIRIATRGSALALFQANLIAGMLREADPSARVELVLRTTRGDKVLDRPLYEIGGKGLFVKEIEAALLEGEADLAVHSMKDVPTVEDPRLSFAAHPKREDPRDALVAAGGARLRDLPAGSRVGTSSVRRASQLAALRPDLVLVPLRGNVDTRVRKVDEGALAAAVLAAAGLTRLGLSARITEYFDAERIVPGGAQGAIGVQMRAEDAAGPLGDLVRRACDDPAAGVAARAERAFLAELRGGCRSPIGAHLQPTETGFRFLALVAEPDGSKILRETVEGPATADPEALAREAARRILASGAEAILEKTRDPETLE